MISEVTPIYIVIKQTRLLTFQRKMQVAPPLGQTSIIHNQTLFVYNI